MKTPSSLSGFLDRCLEHSIEHLKKPNPVLYDGYEMSERDLEVFSWPQTWGNTSTGFGGMAGQMMTTAQTVVTIGPMGDACVYHNGFAYKVEIPSDKFFECVNAQRLPGKADKRDFLEKREK